MYKHPPLGHNDVVVNLPQIKVITTQLKVIVAFDPFDNCPGRPASRPLTEVQSRLGPRRVLVDVAEAECDVGRAAEAGEDLSREEHPVGRPPRVPPRPLPLGHTRHVLLATTDGRTTSVRPAVTDP